MPVRRQTLGEVIGERQLVVVDAPRKRVTVSLGKPRPAPWGEDWECPFRIRGAGMSTLKSGYGVDAIQALICALEGIRAVLDQSGQSFAWRDVLPDDTGFPRTIPIAFGGEFSRRLDRIIDREMTARLRTLERRHTRRASKKRPVTAR